MESGANINKQDFVEEIPLLTVCKKGNKDVVKYLVEHGGDIHKVNNYGCTPGFYACQSGHEAIV